MTIFLLHGWHTDIVSDTSMTLEERVKEIKEEKPKNEQAIRLRLIREVKPHDLPAKLQKAFLSRGRAYENYVLARGKNSALRTEISREAYDRAADELNAADDALDRALLSPSMQRWHKKFCGCKEWNGKEIVFPK